MGSMESNNEKKVKNTFEKLYIWNKSNGVKQIENILDFDFENSKVVPRLSPKTLYRINIQFYIIVRLNRSAIAIEYQKFIFIFSY